MMKLLKNCPQNVSQASTHNSTLKKSLAFSLILSFVLTSFLDDAEARRRRRRVKKKRAPIINEKKLYERMGGSKSVAEITEEWIRMNLADPRVASTFSTTQLKNDKIAKWRKGLSDQVCEWGEGPCQAKSIDGDLKKAQEKLAQDEAQFLAYSDNLFRSLQKYNVKEREKNELLSRLGDFREGLLPEEE